MRLVLVASAIFALIGVAGSACNSSSNDGSSGGGAGTSTSSSGGSGGTSSGAASSGATSSGAADAANDAPSASMTLTSTAFQVNGNIPAAHTCDGAGVSIPLSWGSAPPGTKSYAIVMRDLTFTNGGNNYHWVLWDIPATTTSIPQGILNEASPDPPGGGAKQIHWSFGAEIGYGNICPISGPPTHEYEITVLSFSVSTLSIGDATGPNEIDAILQANRTSSANLRGKYTKQ